MRVAPVVVRKGQCAPVSKLIRMVMRCGKSGNFIIKFSGKKDEKVNIVLITISFRALVDEVQPRVTFVRCGCVCGVFC